MSKASRRKEIIKAKTRIKNRKTIEKSNETKNRFFEKTNKIDKPLETLIGKTKERWKI